MELLERSSSSSLKASRRSFCFVVDSFVRRVANV